MVTASDVDLGNFLGPVHLCLSVSAWRSHVPEEILNLDVVLVFLKDLIATTGVIGKYMSNNDQSFQSLLMFGSKVLGCNVTIRYVCLAVLKFDRSRLPMSEAQA